MPKTTADEALELAKKLSKQLDDRSAGIEKHERYFHGRHNIRFATRKFREAFGALFREFADNYCGLVVESTAERLRIEGFRIPTPKKEKEAEDAAREAVEKQEEEAQAKAEHEAAVQAVEAEASAAATAHAAESKGAAAEGRSAPAPPKAPTMPTPPTAAPATPGPIGPLETSGISVGANTGDTDAWEIWQKNNLDLYSDIAHETALTTGYAYILVGPQDDGSTDEPIVTVEHPLEVITRHAAGNTKEVTAAIKRWWDQDTGHAYLTLFMPDSVWKFQSSQKTKNAIARRPDWVPREGVDFGSDNPFGEKVPVVPIVNRVDLSGYGKSEIADIIPIQDAINKLTNDMMVASEFAAFRQRILTGMEIPEDEHGNIIPDFDLKAAIDRIMVIKDEDVRVHEFGVTDLDQYVKAIEHLRDDVAAISRTPPQYLVGEVVNSSSEALKAAESGLVKKVQKRQRFFGESWEEAIRLAFALMGDDERAESWAAETIWANPEVMTEAALADSLAKYMILGVPMVALWEKLGASQTEIQRWLQLRATEPELPMGMPAAIGSLARAGEKDVE